MQTRLTLRPGQSGTKKLVERFGERLWDGHRSSRLGLQWRVIYRTAPDQQLFQVVSITPHDYRRP